MEQKPNVFDDDKVIFIYKTNHYLKTQFNLKWYGKLTLKKVTENKYEPNYNP